MQNNPYKKTVASKSQEPTDTKGQVQVCTTLPKASLTQGDRA